jgi:hypothetical protein
MSKKLMEMGYKALKEAMTDPFSKSNNLPKLVNPRPIPKRPNPNTIRDPYDVDYIGPTNPPIFNKNTTSMTDAPPITHRDFMSGPRSVKPRNIPLKITAPSTGRSGRGVGFGAGSVKEAMTNPLADQNPLRNPAQSPDPNRGLGLITLRLR